MTTFLESPYFPDDLAVWAIGGAGYKTSVVGNGGGWEARTPVWEYSRGSWDLQNVLRAFGPDDQVAALTRVRNVFRVMKAQAYGFRFRDWTDYTDEGGGVLGLTGLGDGTTTVFQLYKNYTLGSGGGTMTDQRLIRKPRPSDPTYPLTAFVNGVSTAVTFDTTVGTATFSVAPANGAALTWTGAFDVPCRFSTDNFMAVADPSGLYVIQTLGLIELRL